MLSTNLRSAALLCLPLAVLAAPFPSSQQIPLDTQSKLEKAGPLSYHSTGRFPIRIPGISKSLFDEFNDHAKIADIANCVESLEEIVYPFEYDSYCKEFPGLELVMQWNTNDDGLAELGEDTHGYITADHDGKKIFVTMAGSHSISLTPETVDYDHACPGCKVHESFHQEWEALGGPIKQVVKQYFEARDPFQTVVIVGSQGGGAVATLVAADFVSMGWNTELTTFGQPMVGNDRYAQFLASKFTPSTYRRVNHILDSTPKYPLTGEKARFFLYEPSFFISKRFSPYVPSNILPCTDSSDPQCAVPLPLAPATVIVPADYFHHSANCVADEITSLFSSFTTDILDSGIISDLLFKLKRSTLDTGLNPNQDIFVDLPGLVADHDIFVDLPGVGAEQNIFIGLPGFKDDHLLSKRKITGAGGDKASPDVDTETVVADSKFKKTFAMVEKSETVPESEREPVYVPEYEDKDIYSAMTGFPKAQSMWIKPQPAPGPTSAEKNKRSKLSDDNADFESPALKNAIEMLDKPVPVPTEYEDKEIYDTMAGFDKAQKMWIKKPQGVASKQKISNEFFEDQMLPESEEIEKRDVISINPMTILQGWTEMGQETMLKNIDLDHATRNMQQRTLEKRHSVHSTHSTIIAEPVNITEAALEKRGFDRALRFFNAPKDVLEAQLAANQESAAYNAQQRALADGKTDSETGENIHPDEDYFRKGGSVLLLNGRPLEVDGHPVLFEPKEKEVQSVPAPTPAPAQKRSVIPAQKGARGPGLGIKKGGLRRGDKDSEKVTKLQSAPGDTRSVSEVGGFANAFPASFGEEVVNVQKGRNVVLMNGQPMPANFAQKSVYGDDLPGTTNAPEGDNDEKPLSREQMQKDLPSLKEMWAQHENAGAPVTTIEVENQE